MGILRFRLILFLIFWNNQNANIYDSKVEIFNTTNFKKQKLDIVYIIMGSLLTLSGLMGFRHFKRNFKVQYADIMGISTAVVTMAIGISLIISAII